MEINPNLRTFGKTQKKTKKSSKTGKAMFLASDADTSTMSSALDQLESELDDHFGSTEET